MGLFIPKRHRDWLPEHMRGTPQRRCYWCVSGPHRKHDLLVVLESPMRYHFCSDECCTAWQQRRHDGDILEWLKCGTGERAQVLKQEGDAVDTSTTACRRAFAGLCSDSRVALSMRKDT
jgi:hypothetical protein